MKQYIRHIISVFFNYRILLLFIALVFSGCSSLMTADSLKDTKTYLDRLGKNFSIKELSELKRLNLSDSAVTDSGLRYISNLKKLEVLLLKRTEVTGSGLHFLENNTALTSLDLESTQVEDGQIADLLKLKNLHYLNLSKTAISDEGVKSISTLQSLIELNLSGTLITDVGIQYISHLKLQNLFLSKTDTSGNTIFCLGKNKNLRYLDLSYTRLSGSSLSHIDKLKSLKVLNISGTSITDSALEFFSYPSGLDSFDVSDNAVTDKGLAILTEMCSIKNLNLSNTKITGKGFQHFKKLKKLKKLYINGISSSYRNLMLLKISMPKVDIIAEYMVYSAEESDFIGGYLKKKSDTLRTGIGDVWLKEPLIPGVGVPFEVVFFDENRRIKKDYKLQSDLIFKLNGVNITVFSGKNFKRGNGILTFSRKDANFKAGVFKGDISVNRILTGRVLEVWLKGKGDKHDIFVGETYSDLMFRDVAGVYFSHLKSTFKAGESFNLRIHPFDYRGYPVRKWPDRGLRFFIDSEIPVSISGISAKGSFFIKPEVCDKGVAEVSVKTEKAGSYRILYRNGREYNRPFDKGTWNNVSFSVRAAEYIKSIAQVPDSSEAGENFKIKLWLFDRFNNVKDKTHFNFFIEPLSFGKVFKNLIPLKKETVYDFDSEKDWLSITESGIYWLNLISNGKTIRKKIDIRPSEINVSVKKKKIIVNKKLKKILIPYELKDKYGNAPDTKFGFKFRILTEGSGSAVTTAEGLGIVRSNIISDNEKEYEYKIELVRGCSGGIIKVSTNNIEFLKISIGKNDFEFKFITPELTRTKIKKAGVFKIQKISLPDKGITPDFLSRSLKSRPDRRIVYRSWKKKLGKTMIQYEFTFYRKWNRLDYQEWDLMKKKRIKRVLWRNLHEKDIHVAAAKGMSEIPGEKEIFK